MGTQPREHVGLEAEGKFLVARLKLVPDIGGRAIYICLGLGNSLRRNRCELDSRGRQHSQEAVQISSRVAGLNLSNQSR